MNQPPLTMKIHNIKFWLHFNVTHPTKVFLMNLSWIPFWYLRKQISPIHIQWTPAATIRHLQKECSELEKHKEDYWKHWHETETQLRAERMARVLDKMSPEQKEWSEQVMGVRFKGGETN